jgi:hypothetical protein
MRSERTPIEKLIFLLAFLHHPTRDDYLDSASF